MVVSVWESVSPRTGSLHNALTQAVRAADVKDTGFVPGSFGAELVVFHPAAEQLPHVCVVQPVRPDEKLGFETRFCADADAPRNTVANPTSTNDRIILPPLVIRDSLS